jgi:hypothetical protein
MTSRPSFITPGGLERATLLHVGVLVLAASWAYGGNIGWARSALAIIASLGAFITLAAFLQSGETARVVARALVRLYPHRGREWV